jgi:GcrA cell cycle regulator
MNDFTINQTNGLPSPWTDDRVERLRSMWDAGAPASTIADTLGGGLTKSSVLGKARRLDLPARPTGFSEPEDVRTAKRAARANGDRRLSQVLRTPRERRPDGSLPGLEIVESPQAPGFLGIPLLDLERNMCRFPRGDGPFLFCGQPTERGSYCGHCYRIVYQPARYSSHGVAA